MLIRQFLIQLFPIFSHLCCLLKRSLSVSDAGLSIPEFQCLLIMFSRFVLFLNQVVAALQKSWSPLSGLRSRNMFRRLAFTAQL
jgi:hypothetical protein